MSLKRMLEEKTDHIVEASRAEARAPDQGRQRPVTAPGALFGLRQEMTKNEERVAELESALGRYQGALPTRKLDPKRVRTSRWANRHPATFREPEFVALKA
jgi:ParB family transcriptional regulator, chromosome partitioning protein